MLKKSQRSLDIAITTIVGVVLVKVLARRAGGTHHHYLDAAARASGFAITLARVAIGISVVGAAASRK